MIQTIRLDKNSEFRKQPAMARLLRAWEVLTADQREDLVYLAQSMVNRNRREGRKIQTATCCSVASSVSRTFASN